MKDGKRQMIAVAYDETVAEALCAGQPAEVAHREGVAAAATILSAMTGIGPVAARAEVEALGLTVH